MNGLKKDLEKTFINLFIIESYIEKNIENFIKELEEADLTVISDVKNKNLFEKLQKQMYALKVISEVIDAKKLWDNPEDMKKLGKYIQKIGLEIYNNVELENE